jgi:flagellar motility protein MotE (MotC chaperone)
MKNTLIYVLAFVSAFIVVTWALIFLNNSYENIFAFNFTPRSATPAKDTTQIKMPALLKPRKKVLPLLQKPAPDTTAVIAKTNDSVEAVKSREVMLLDSLNSLEKLLIEKSKNPKDIKKVLTKSESPADFSNKKDSSYNVWLKNTSGLFEVMDSKKAAKIIQNYSDNVARDILYSMKKKNAAQIIAELSPEVANRIIRLR